MILYAYGSQGYSSGPHTDGIELVCSVLRRGGGGCTLLYILGENGIVSFARNNVISMYRHSFLGYRIARNFRGRKLSQIGEKDDFRGENFPRLLPFAAPTDSMHVPKLRGEKFRKYI